MKVMVLGVVLIIIALVAGGVQILRIYNIYGNGNLYGDASNRWYFYGGVGLIGLIGIILVAWTLLKKDRPKETQQQQ
jgi:hypothetical protein